MCLCNSHIAASLSFLNVFLFYLTFTGYLFRSSHTVRSVRSLSIHVFIFCSFSFSFLYILCVYCGLASVNSCIIFQSFICHFLASLNLSVASLNSCCNFQNQFSLLLWSMFESSLVPLIAFYGHSTRSIMEELL